MLSNSPCGTWENVDSAHLSEQNENGSDVYCYCENSFDLLDPRPNGSLDFRGSQGTLGNHHLKPLTWLDVK